MEPEFDDTEDVQNIFRNKNKPAEEKGDSSESTSIGTGKNSKVKLSDKNKKKNSDQTKKKCCK